MIRLIRTLTNTPIIVEGVIVMQEFKVVEMANNTTYSTLLGRQWLYDTQDIQDWGKRTFTLFGGN